MDNCEKVKAAYADAVLSLIWVAGLITDQERSVISAKTLAAIKKEEN